MTIDEFCEYANKLEELIKLSCKLMEEVLEDYSVKGFDDFLDIEEIKEIRRLNK